MMRTYPPKDFTVVVAALINGKPIYSVSNLQTGDVAIVEGIDSRRMHCYKCTLRVDNDASDSCKHMKAIRKAQVLSSPIPEQPAEKIVFVLDKLANVISNCVVLSPYNTSIMDDVHQSIRELRESLNASLVNSA